MSYIVIKLYSFACDGEGCSAVYDCAPEAWGPPRLLDAALADLRREGWAVQGRSHYCPEHKPAGAVQAAGTED